MMPKSPKFLAVDFYCGAGGTTRGLLDAGGYVICGIDNDEANRETFQRNNHNNHLDESEPLFLALDMFPESDNYPEGQQEEVRVELGKLIRQYRRMAPELPLMFVVCAPCQSFTRFVQRKMTPERTKGRERDLDLLSQTVGFIKEFQPEMVISENVSNIRRGSHKKVWSDFEKALLELEYIVGEDSVCASDFGVPQMRRRSVLLALKAKKGRTSSVELSVPRCDPDTNRVSVRGAIGHLPELKAGERNDDIPNHACRNLIEKNQQRLMSVEPGEPNFKLSDTPFGDLSLDCHRRLSDNGQKGFGDVYTRIHPERPSPTITTRFLSISNGRFGHYDKEQVRGLSLREGAILQSFPDSYEFYSNNMDTVARMIGNAVPPKLSEFMATWLYEKWSESRSQLPNSIQVNDG